MRKSFRAGFRHVLLAQRELEHAQHPNEALSSGSSYMTHLRRTTDAWERMMREDEGELREAVRALGDLPQARAAVVSLLQLRLQAAGLEGVTGLVYRVVAEERVRLVAGRFLKGSQWEYYPGEGRR